MAELTVRQNELVVTINPREKRRLTWSGLRKSRSKLLNGMELRVPLAKVAGVHASDSAYWELQEQMDARDTMRSSQTKVTYEPSDMQPWIGIFHVTEDGMEEKKLCFIHGQYSEVVIVDLDKGSKGSLHQAGNHQSSGESESVAAGIKAAAGLT